MFCLPVCRGTMWVLAPMEIKKEVWFPPNRRQLWDAMWKIRIKPRSSGRAAGARNWSSPLQPHTVSQLLLSVFWCGFWEARLKSACFQGNHLTLVQACILLSIDSCIHPAVHWSICAPIVLTSRGYYLYKGILIFRFIQEVQHIFWLWQAQSCYIHFGVLVFPK